MLTQLVVRRADKRDLPDCAKLIKAWMDETIWLNTRPSIGGIKSVLRETFERQEIWVAGEEIEGYCAVDPDLDHVCALYSRRRGHGVGKDLLDAAKHGRTGLTVNTHAPNIRAQRFYAREGFRSMFEINAIQPETVSEMRMEWRR